MHFRKKSDTVAHTYAFPVFPMLLMGRAVTFPSFSITSAPRQSGMRCPAGMSPGGGAEQLFCAARVSLGACPPAFWDPVLGMGQSFTAGINEQLAVQGGPGKSCTLPGSGPSPTPPSSMGFEGDLPALGRRRGPIWA